MGAVIIICSCESKNTMHVSTTETGPGIYEHIFVCKDCETTSVFRMTQLLSARSDPNCLI